jgi:predicted dehydrogenase
MLKIGVIGCGMVAEGHFHAIEESTEWELTAIVEVNPERLAQVQEQFKPQHAFSDYNAMLESVELDAVVVATHVESHHEITIAALRRGLHVLCEKPMADTVEKCREMCEEAARQGKMLAVNFNTRSSEPYLTIKGIIDSGVIGKIRVVRFVYDWSAHQWEHTKRIETFMANGGPVIDSAVHFYEGVRWYTGQEFERIDACGTIIPPHEHPQHVISTCQMTDGSIALVEAGWLFTRRTKDRDMLYNVTVIGDDGTADYNGNTDSIRLWTATETQEIPCVDLDKHFDRVHAYFAHSIKLGELKWLASGEDGLRATEAAYNALASAHQGKPMSA